MSKEKKEFNYAQAGVDRGLRKKSKEGLIALQKTYRLVRYGFLIELPFGRIFPIGDGRYMELVIEGIGTKVLFAQLADKYDTIGIDGAAMALNDLRSGARPLAIVDNIHAQVSDPELVKEWLKGVCAGAVESRCPVVGGEIGDTDEIIKGIKQGKGFDMVFAAIGEVNKKDIIDGRGIKPGDVVIGLRSSGVHSNGISLVRKVLFKEWGGKYEPFDVPAGLERELIYEALEPTKIYTQALLAVARDCKIKGVVHITGDAYLKFENLMKFSPGIGFEFSNFKPQPIFKLIQETAAETKGFIADEEMFRTFNMGWGEAFVVAQADGNKVIDACRRVKIQAEKIGEVTDKSGKIIIHYDGKEVELR